MASLTGSSIASSYEQLLALPDGGLNGTTLVAITDGDSATEVGFKISTNALSMNSTNQLQFGDTGTYIHQSADGVLDLVSDTEIEINATTIDINGAAEISGKLGIGGTASVDELEVFNTASDTASEVAITTQSSAGNASALILRANRNDTVGSHTVVTNGQFLGQVLFQGSDGTNYEDAARIFATVDGSPAGDATDMPGALNFATTVDGSDSMTTHMIIKNDGKVFIDQDSDVIALEIDTEATTADGLLFNTPTQTTGYVLNTGSANSLTTGGIAYFRSNASTTDTRSLVSIINDHASATGATALKIQQDSTGNALHISAGGNDVMKVDSNSRISLSNNDASARNTIFGYQAMNVSGAAASDNVAIGNEAMHDVGTAQFNVAVGSLALTKEVNGDRNTAIGYQSLYSQSNSGTEVPENVGVGIYAGFTNVTGIKNTYVGGNAGFGSASGSNSSNTGIGYNALLDISTGSSNVAVGISSGENITSGIGNVLLGQDAGKGLVGSHNNVIIGREAGSVATATIQTNVIIGYGAGKGALEGGADGMVAVGASALGALTSGAKNVAIGFESAKAVTTGQRNTILGHQAFLTSVDADECVVIGNYAMGSGVATADGTVAIGRSSLSGLTSGAGNTAVGYQSMDATDDGSYNTAVGYTSLSANCGDSNTCIGYASGLLITGSMNVTIGTDAGNSITGGTNNVVIGKGSDTDDATATNQTVVGYATTGVADNSVTLGNADVTAVYMAQDSGATVHAQKINLDSQTLDLTDDFIGIQATYKKTTGTSDNNDDLTALKSVIEFEDDQTIGDVKGAYIASQINTSGSGESGSIYGIDVLAQQSQYGSIDTNAVFGMNVFVDVNGNTVDGDVTGLYVKLDSSNPTGVQEAVYLDMNANADRFLRAFDSANSTARVLISSAGQIDAEGTINASQSLDYAEYFESKDGKEIAVGITVKLDENKIVACSDGDTPLGVIRPKSGKQIVGGGQLFHWENKYVKDDYGADIWEDYTITKWIEEVTSEIYLKRGKDETGGVHGGSLRYYKEEPVLYNEDDTLPSGKQIGDVKTGVKYFCEHQYHSDYLPKDVSAPSNAETIEPSTQRQKLNPDFDISKTYKSREERTEWHIVGLLGQIPITKGQPVASNWMKMKDVSDKVEMYFVK